MKKARREIKSNVMQGYDENGELIMYYWQKEPIKQVWGFGGFKVSWKFRYNPIWRIKQWWWTRKGIRYGKGELI